MYSGRVIQASPLQVFSCTAVIFTIGEKVVGNSPGRGKH